MLQSERTLHRSGEQLLVTAARAGKAQYSQKRMDGQRVMRRNEGRIQNKTKERETDTLI